MTALSDAELLALHREIVAIPSLSGQEGPLVEHLRGWFAARGVEAERIGDNLVARFGEAPFFCLNTHLDTVPACAGSRSSNRAETRGRSKWSASASVYALSPLVKVI